jgi:ABC-type multidrug transport system permease subunit
VKSEPASHPLFELTLARIRETLREPEIIFWVFVFPVLLAVALGIAFREKPAERLRIAVVEGHGVEQTIRLLSRNPNLEPVIYSSEQAFQEFRAGRVNMVIEPGEELVLVYDPTQSQSELARLIARDTIEQGLGRQNLAAIRDEQVTAPGSRYIDFFLPGLIAMNLMGSGMWGVGFAVVLARTRKLLKRLAATPMRRSHYLLAFMLSRMIFLIPEVALLVLFGWLLFGVKVAGSLLDLALVSALGSLTFAGLGLLVASRSKTIEAASGWMNFIMMPMYVLSGVFFSYTRFPKIFIPLIRAMPLTALTDALRAVMNEGKPLAGSGLEIAVLLFWGLASFAVALKIFRWQ